MRDAATKSNGADCINASRDSRNVLSADFVLFARHSVDGISGREPSISRRSKLARKKFKESPLFQHISGKWIMTKNVSLWQTRS